jgi:hypothetical protein
LLTSGVQYALVPWPTGTLAAAGRRGATVVVDH